MKRTILLFLVSALFGNVLNAQEKAFQKKKITISIGAGLGVYGTKTHQEQDQSVYSGGAIKTIRSIKDTTGGAGSGIYPIIVEYGLTNWLGIGGRFAFSKYIAKGDSTNKNIKPTVTGLDGDLVLNLHFIKTVHFDMPLQFVAGYSNLKYLSNDRNGDMAKGGGFNYGVSLVPRIYFGRFIGIFFNVGYVGYNYPNLIYSNNTGSNLNASNGNLVSKLKGNGVNIGGGLVVKFH